MNPTKEPIFNELGALPQGFSEWTIGELTERLAFSTRRKELLENLQQFLSESEIAKSAHELWVDGSFAEDKIEPGDIDILLIMHRRSVSEPASNEVDYYSSAESRAKLYNELGIDLNWCLTNDKVLGTDWYFKFFSIRTGEMTNYRKGIVRLSL